MIRFAHPQILMLLWAVPALLALVWWEYIWRLNAMKRWAKSPLWDVALPMRAPGRVFLQRILTTVAIGLIFIALAGPQVGTRLIEVKREGTDVVIALDVSESMNAEDIQPSRLIKARHEIIRLLKQLRGDRVALVPFAGVAFVQSPLTLDYSAVATMLNAIEPGIIPDPGTSLSEAIKQSMAAFKMDSKAEKIIVLITDSEDHDSNPIELAKEAAKAGIKIFTIGMATPEGAPVPIKDDRGRLTGYKQYKNNTVVSRLNEDLLRQISDVSGGEYFRATKTGREFERFHERISGMKTEEFESKQFTDYEDRFQWFLGLALVILFVSGVILPARRETDVA